MLNIFRILLRILDKQSKQKFVYLIILLLISGALSLIGIGAVIPFITVLFSPEKNWLSAYIGSDQQANILTVTLFLMIASFWLKNLAYYYCIRTQGKVLYGIAYKIAREVFDVYMRAPYAWHLSQSSPELIRNVINECYVVANGVLAQLGIFATELVTSLFVFIFLLYIDVKFTLLVSVALFCCMLSYAFITRKKVKFYADQRAESWALMTQNVMQGIGGIKETKIYDLEQHFIQSFNLNSNVAADSLTFSSVYSQASRFALEAVAVTVVMLAIFFILLNKHSNNEIILILSIFGVAAMQLLPSLNRLMTSFSSIKYSQTALHIIEQALGYKAIVPLRPDMTNKPEHNSSSFFRNEIRLENISFSYPDGTRALNDVSLTIKKGQSIALVGYSGAGKTSLADIILGLFNPKSGRILIDNVELNAHNLMRWRKLLGYIPQSIYLYDCTIKENVAFGVNTQDIDEAQVWDALHIASLKEFVKSLPKGLETEIGENGVRLSGGQRQRIGIARAIFRNPEILIMDEATAALDNDTEKEVTQAIQAAAINRTVVTIAHRLSTIKNSDVIYMMESGRIVASGSYQELIDHCEMFKRLAHIETLNMRAV